MNTRSRSIHASAAFAFFIAVTGCFGPGSGSSGNGGTDDGTGASGGDPSGDPAGGTNTGASTPGSSNGGNGSSSNPTSGSSGMSGVASLFGSHLKPYSAGTILPSGGQAALDKATSDFYDAWKAKYLIKGCGGYYVATTLDDNSGGGQSDDSITVSEAHGYGMLIAALMAGYDEDAHAIYDGLYAFFRAHPSVHSPDLMAWEQIKGCASSSDNDSATDGDLDIAYSLMLASELWPGGSIDYGAEAKKVIAAISAHEINPKTNLTLLGDWSTPADMYYGTRPSDFMPDHFRAYAAFSGDTSFATTTDSLYTLVATMQTLHAPTTGLVPDFVVSTNTDAPAPAPSNYLEDTTDGDYAYNACRVPWRLGTDVLVNGESRGKTAVASINAWIQKKTGGDASKIGTNYTLTGTSTDPSDASMAFTAPFGVGAMIDAKNQAWLDAIWTAMVGQSLTAEGDYFGNTVKLLSMIVMSQNWWAP